MDLCRDEVEAVSRRALIQRIRRRLAHDDMALKITRGWGRARQELGDYYVIDARSNCVVEKHVDLEELARDKFVLQPREKVRDEETAQ